MKDLNDGNKLQELSPLDMMAPEQCPPQPLMSCDDTIDDSPC